MQRNKKKGKERIRNRNQVRAVHEAVADPKLVTPLRIKELWEPILTLLQKAEVTFGEIEQKIMQINSEKNDKKKDIYEGEEITILIQYLENLIPLLNNYKDYYNLADLVLVNIKQQPLDTFLCTMKSTISFLNRMITLYKVTNIFERVDSTGNPILNSLLETFSGLVVTISKATEKKYFFSTDVTKGKWDFASSREVLLDSLCSTQFLDGLYRMAISRISDGPNDPSLVENKKWMDKRSSYIQLVSNQLTVEQTKGEYQAFELALQAQCLINNIPPDIEKTRECYKKINTLLGTFHVIKMPVFALLLSEIAYELSEKIEGRDLLSMTLKKHWLVQALKWHNPSVIIPVVYSKKLAQVQKELQFTYYVTLLTLANDKRYQDYFDIELMESGFNIKIKLLQMDEKLYLLKKILREAKIEFKETDDNQLIFDCEKNYVSPQRLVSTLDSFITQLEAEKNRLPDYSWLKKTEASEGKVVDKVGENKPKADEENEVSKQDLRLERHLKQEELRQIAREEKTKNPLKKKKKLAIVIRKEEGEMEPNTFISELPGKRLGVYHCHLDRETLRKKNVPEEVLDTADGILATATKRSFSGSGVILFYQNKSMRAKIKIGKENIRLFGGVKPQIDEEGYQKKDEKGRLHFTIEINEAKNKHRKG